MDLTQIPSLNAITTHPSTFNNVDTLPKDSYARECAICLLEYSDLDILPTCSKQQHFFCKTCAVQYLHVLIAQSNVYKIPCPQDGCKEVMEESLISKILDKTNIEYLNTFNNELVANMSLSGFAVI